MNTLTEFRVLIDAIGIEVDRIIAKVNDNGGLSQVETTEVFDALTALANKVKAA